MSEPLKFCRDCVHYFPKTAVDCRAPENQSISLVTGEKIVADAAVMSRGLDTIGCGRIARWFNPREIEETA